MVAGSWGAPPTRKCKTQIFVGRGRQGSGLARLVRSDLAIALPSVPPWGGTPCRGRRRRAASRASASLAECTPAAVKKKQPDRLHFRAPKSCSCARTPALTSLWSLAIGAEQWSRRPCPDQHPDRRRRNLLRAGAAMQSGPDSSSPPQRVRRETIRSSARGGSLGHAYAHCWSMPRFALASWFQSPAHAPFAWFGVAELVAYKLTNLHVSKLWVAWNGRFGDLLQVPPLPRHLSAIACLRLPSHPLPSSHSKQAAPTRP